MHVRRGDGFGRAGGIDEDLRISAGLDIGHAVRAERQVAGAGDVALEGGNTIGGANPRDVGEVDLVGTVLEVGDLVRRGSGRLRRGVVGEGDLSGASGQRVGAGAAGDLVVTAVAHDDVVARAADNRVRGRTAEDQIVATVSLAAGKVG